MNGARWERVKELHARALELPADEREAFLRRECGDDEELYRQVAALLTGGPPAEAFLEPPAVDRDPDARESLPRLLGEFELLRRIGAGGMGVVYLARQPSLDRLVAVKVLPPHLTRTQRDVDRFRREALAVAKVRHPGIVTVHVVGVEGDTPYFSMDLVEGHGLGDELRLQRGEVLEGADRPILPRHGTPGYVAAVARVVAEVAEALQAAHDHGVVHRDVKPQNLLLDAGGHPRVVDFGLAKVAELVSLSRTGEIAGTPHYMSPEQAAAARRPQIDHRTDIYSLGVVLYELLTLRRPHEGRTSQEILYSIEHREPPSIHRLDRRVPRDLETICAAAISKRPEDRYATAGALAEDLRRFLGHEAILRRPPSLWARARARARRHRVALAAAGVLLVGGAAGALGLRELDRRGADARAHAELADAIARFDELPPADCVAVLERCRRQEREGRLRAPTRALLAELDGLVGGRAGALEAEARDALALLLDPPARVDPQVPDFGDAPRLVGAVERFVEAALYRGALSPEIAAQLVLLQTPAVDVEVAPPGDALVLAQRVDPITGALAPARALGSVPLRGASLPEGLYRLTVVRDGVGFAEAVRRLEGRGQAHAVAVALRPDAEVDGLVDVEGGEVELVVGVGRGGREVTLRRPVASFRIDRYPVTNAAYARFVEATGAPPPLLWTSVEPADRPDDWDERPVTGVTLEEARAYAEWQGKRLPTYEEWLLAARGPAWRRFPWGDEPDGRLDAYVLGRPSPFALGDDEGEDLLPFTAYYLRHVEPVRPLPEACRGPSGMDHVLGNVWEWVDTPAFDAVGGRLEEMHLSTYRVGHAGHSQNARERGLQEHTWGLSHKPLLDTGFRCAKSAAPPPYEGERER